MRLEALLAPWTPEAFLGQVRELRPMALPRRDLPLPVGLDDLDALLADRTLAFPSARVLGPGGTLDPATYSHPSLPWGPSALHHVLRPEAVVALMRQGASLAFDRLDRQLAAVRPLRLAVARWLCAETSVNAYLSPPGGSAFPPHWDTQDVFVLQTAGTKRWWVYAPQRPLPLRVDACPPGGLSEPGELLLDVVLEPGDALYVPRGFVHHALAGDTASLHLSVSVTPLTTADLLGALGAGTVPELAAARRALPATWSPRLEALDPDAHALLRAGHDEAQVLEAWGGLLDRVVLHSPPGAMGWLRHVAAPPAAIQAEQRVVAMPQLARLSTVAQGVSLVVPGRTLLLPDYAAPALSALLQPDTPVGAGSLPGLSEEEALELVTHLLDEGVLGVVQSVG